MHLMGVTDPRYYIDFSNFINKLWAYFYLLKGFFYRFAFVECLIWCVEHQTIIPCNYNYFILRKVHNISEHIYCRIYGFLLCYTKLWRARGIMENDFEIILLPFFCSKYFSRFLWFLRFAWEIFFFVASFCSSSSKTI